MNPQDKFEVGKKRIAEFDAMPQRELAYKMLEDFRLYVEWIHLQAYGCPFVFEEVHYTIIDALQKFAEGQFPTRNLAINVMPGCLAGDTQIIVNRGGGAKRKTLEHLYCMFNGGTRGGKQWDLNIPTYVRKMVDGKIGLWKVVGVYYNGIKPIYSLLLEDGKTIKATACHRFFTSTGWKRLDELSVGELLAVDNMEKRGTGRRKKTTDKDFGVGEYHPYKRAHNGCYRISYHRAVYEANLNNMSLEEFKLATKNPDVAKTLKYSNPNHHIHHINHNHYDDRPENLVSLSPEEHIKIHNAEREQNFGQGEVSYSRVKSIEYIGKQRVYDIETENNPNNEGNFVANGIVVHNCGKTTLVQYWISWCFARCRSAMFLYVNAVEAIVKELSANTRDLLLLPAWQRLYGVEIDNTKLSGAQTSKTRWSLKNGGLNSGLIAKTTYSSLLGLNAGNPNADGFPGGLILDDPQGSSIITQEYERQQTQALYKRDMESRRRGTQIGTIVVQQRLHIDDLTGFLKRTEPGVWTFISVPALVQDDDGKYRSTCPRVKSVAELLEMREKNPYDFHSLYQQEPIVWGGAIYKEEWMKYYEHLPKINHLILAADTAVKDGEHNDYSVIQLWGKGADGNAYLIDHIRGKWKTPDLRKQCVAFYAKCLERFPTLRRFWIEDKASGMGLIQEINKDVSDAGLPRMSIMPFQKGARQNKAIMNNDAANYFEESRVWLPKLTPWLSEVVGELLSFDPSNKHATDDICDTVAMACKVLLTHRSNAFMNL